MQTAEPASLMHKTIQSGRQPQANSLQIPIAHSKPIGNICSDPAVSSPEYYPTSAPIVDAIGEALLSGKHLIILNNSSHSEFIGIIDSLSYELFVDAEHYVPKTRTG